MLSEAAVQLRATLLWVVVAVSPPGADGAVVSGPYVTLTTAPLVETETTVTEMSLALSVNV